MTMNLMNRIPSLIGRGAMALFLAVGTHAAQAATPLDELVLRNGAVVPPIALTAANTTPTLASLGRIRNSAKNQDFSLWEVHNTTTAVRHVRVEAIADAFAFEVDVPAQRRLVFRSPVVKGTAPHRLVVDSVSQAAVQASTTAYADATSITPATGSNHAPVWLSAAPAIAELAPNWRYAPIVLDADNDPVTLTRVSGPNGMALDSVSGAFVWQATASQIGDNTAVLRATDGRGGSVDQTACVRLVTDYCPIYPIDLPASAFASAHVDQVFTQLPRGTAPGNFNWLTWAGKVDPNTLATSLTPPGNVETYVDPDASADRELDVADWAQGATGSMNASAVRSRMDALIGREIIVPLWDQTRGSGSHFDYRTASFAWIRLTGYDLTGNNGYLSFVYRGPANCYNDAPTAVAQQVSTVEDQALHVTLSGTDPEHDTLTIAIATPPAHGTLTGTASNLTYTPAADYNGTDVFSFTVADAEFTSAPARIDVAIQAVNDAPVAAAQSVSVNEDGTLAVRIAATDVDSSTLTYSVVTAPQHGTLSGTAPNLTYAPAANYNGPDSFRFKANDGSVDSNIAIVTITVMPVNDPPVALDQATGTREGKSVAVVLTATDIDSSALTYSIVTAPAHGSLTGTAPNLTYTPANGYNGNDSFRFKANDGSADSNIATISIAIAANRPPTANAQSATTAEDTGVNLTLTGADPDGQTISYVVLTPPQHGSLTGTAPSLRYTPAADYSGSDSFTFKTNDGQLDSTAATVTLTVTPVDDAPVAAALAITTAEDTAAAVRLSASDVDSATLSYRVVATPQHGVLSGTAPNLTYTPAANYNGADSFTYVANDGSLDSAAATVALTITAENDPPVAGNQSLSLAEDHSAAITLAATDIDSSLLSFVVVTPPAHGVLAGSAPNLTYTPDADFFGTDSFSFKANDGTDDSNVASISLTITPVNDAPVAQDQSITVDRGLATAITLVALDPDNAQSQLTYLVVASPAHGTLSGSGRDLTYTPTRGYAGTDSFTFRANDGTVDSNTGTISLAVSAGTQPPVASPSSVSVDEDAVLNLVLVASDPDNDPLTYSITSAPQHGALSGTAPNLRYTPVADFNGTDSLSFKVNDGTTDSATVTVSITVVPVNDAPVARSFAVAVAQGTPVAVTLSATDIDSTTVSYAVVTAPQHGVLSGTAPNLVYTPSAGFSGSDSLVYKANDGQDDSAPATVTITVAVDNAPVATATCVTTAENASVAVTLVATDAEGEPLDYLVTVAPLHGTLAGFAPNLTYIPAPGYSGPDVFSFNVSDGHSVSADASVGITVTPNNQAPIAHDLSRVVTEDVPSDVVLSATDIDSKTLTYVVVSKPQHGLLSGTAPNLLYLPDADYNGADSFAYKANDGRVDSNVATVSLTVTPVNDVPLADSQNLTIDEDTPTPIVLIGHDVESFSVTAVLDTQPIHGTVTGTAPNVVYTPTLNYYGADSFTFHVNDGSQDSASATINISIRSVNDRPVAQNQSLATPINTAVSTTLTATDQEGSNLTYRITTAPAHGTVTGTLPKVIYTPASNFRGVDQIVFVANDGSLDSLPATVTVQVGPPNVAPVITSMPGLFAKVGHPYRYDVNATDADNDPLVYSLVNPVAGAVIDATTGLITFTPTVAGTTNFVARVTDGQATVDQLWSLTILEGNVPLTAQLTATPVKIRPGEPVTVALVVTGAGGTVTATSTQDGQPITLAVNGTTTTTASTNGHHTITTSVTDGYDTVTATSGFDVDDGTDTTAPVVHIASPGDTAEVTKPTMVRGSVNDANSVTWTLAFREANSPNGTLTILKQGQGSMVESDLATFDPTMLFNGLYTIILQGTDTAGNVGYDSVVVRVTDEMKVGNFSVTFEDVNIPVAGIPVRVTRTYDTRQRKDNLDFGYGWSVDYQNVRVRESNPAGYSWTIQTQNQGGFEQTCVKSNGDRLVTITLPDGKVESFKAKADPECPGLGGATNYVRVVYVPIDNTQSTLEQTDYGLVTVATIAGSDVYHLVDPDSPGTPIDPRNYKLTTPEGMVYELDQFFGLKKVTEPSGNSLTYSSTGIRHSTGIGVIFNRDGQGRIQSITLPDGKHVTYGYNATGDLTSFADQLQHATTYAYEPRAATKPVFAHYLKDITDARNIRVSRNEYFDELGCPVDSSGTQAAQPACVANNAFRLWRTIDADGHAIEFGHNVTGQIEQIRDRRGYLKTFEYDDSGRVLTETNARNETTRHTYDGNGNELTRKDPLGHETVMTYDVRGNKLTETDPLHHTTTSTFDSRNHLLTQVDAMHRTVMDNDYSSFTGALLSTTDANHHTTTFTYDSGFGTGSTGELVGMEDPLHHGSTYHVDSHGWRRDESDAQGHLTTFQHDANGRVTDESRTRTVIGSGRISTTETLTTHTSYDDKGRVTRVDMPDGRFTTTEYNAIDKPVKTCDALNHCTLMDYDSQGRQYKTTYADNTFDLKTFDLDGNVIAETDRGGRTTKMVYDETGRLRETILPDADGDDGNDANNPRTITAYDPAGRTVGSSDPNGHTTTYGYDDANRRTTVTDALHHDTTTHYDDSGRRDSVTDALNHTTRFGYDDAGRLVQTTFDDNSFTRVEYDDAGRKTAEIDAEGRRTEFGYDELGRLTTVKLSNPDTRVIDAGALITSYGYDELGNKLTQTDAEGRITRWTYDAAGREASRTLPLGQTETFDYDLVGNRVRHTDFNGRTTTFDYDEVNRLKTIHLPNGEGTRSFTYWPSGQRKTVTDASGTTQYFYDTHDRLTNVIDADSRAVEYTYDDAGNRTAVITASQSMVYGFDALNRLKDITATIGSDAPRKTIYDYDAVGNRKSMLRANGTSTEYGYNALNRLTSLAHKTAVGTLLFGAVYAVDASGMRTGITESDEISTTRTVAYTYDSAKRLTSETILARDPANNRSQSWTYDKVGNRLTQTATVRANAPETTIYGYDNNDRLLTEAGASTSTYTYDDNGNTLTKLFDGVTISYHYSSENRLVGMVSGGDRTTYIYDGDGLRIAQTRFPQTGSAVTTLYLLDKNRPYAQVIEERERSGSNTSVMTQINVFADDLVSQGMCGNSSSAIDCNAPSVGYRLADGLDSTRLMTDATGATTDSFQFDAFGNEVDRTGTSPVKHLYRGEQLDEELGFYNLRERWMSPRVGRFLRMDDFTGQKSLPESLHKYNYAGDEPIQGRDPSGRMTLRELGASIAIGATLLTALVDFELRQPLVDNRKDVYLDFANLQAEGYELEEVRQGIESVLALDYGPYGIQFHRYSTGSANRTISFGGSDRSRNEYGRDHFIFAHVNSDDIVEDTNKLYGKKPTFRVKNSELGRAIGNVAAHELGHSYGVPHISHPDEPDSTQPYTVMDDSQIPILEAIPWDQRSVEFLRRRFQ